jgi:hypothetical protein
MKLLSIVVLASVFAMPVASLADQVASNQIAPQAKDCPYAVDTVKAPNVNDAKNIIPSIRPSGTAGKATAGVESDDTSNS